MAATLTTVVASILTTPGDDARCDELQRRVLQMRRSALGGSHEDTHRSAMDVYSRRRQVP